MSSQSPIELSRYGFSQSTIDALQTNAYAWNNWPVVYVLSNGHTGLAYVGETADTLSRMAAHLKHPQKRKLTVIHLIGCEKFNKSATLDIESNLIKYMSGDGQYTLLNGNLGLVDHNYYEKPMYSDIFSNIWDKLRSDGLAAHSLEYINNSDLFKYSPYKTLSHDQRQSLIALLRGLVQSDKRNIVVRGGAGTGKSVLAIFLFKLLHSDLSELNLQEFQGDEQELKELVEKFKCRYPAAKMALVVPMSSFRKTLQKAFANIAGLNRKMVIGPAGVARDNYDVILVDESHRLRQRVNLGAYYGAFDKVCDSLGIDKLQHTELDWILNRSKKAIFFYDEGQSIKPSDVPKEQFDELRKSSATVEQALTSQFRVKGGNGYVSFVNALLHCRLSNHAKFTSNDYECTLYHSLADMVGAIKSKNDEHGLARLIAGYAWPWKSKTNKNEIDIEHDGVELRWNSTAEDWINKENSVLEVGCIHTTQGYDLNYSGIIFGPEITYDENTNCIIIKPEHYFDRNGRQSITDPEVLKNYILNIYSTMMLRGIKGTFVYACDDAFRKYLQKHIPLQQRQTITSSVSRLRSVAPLPGMNAAPFYDLKAAAGNFSEVQQVSQEAWYMLPDDIRSNKSLFVCRVIGESMNRIIPNGALCLFRLDQGGSRNGKTVLVEQTELDPDSGSHFTVKEYQSRKTEDEHGWKHDQIILKPVSNDPAFEPIVLTEDQSLSYRVVAEFVRVLEDCIVNDSLAVDHEKYKVELHSS